MGITKSIRERIQDLKARYERLRMGKEELLKMIDEAEIPENVYNSNAIENSTLSLNETEKILLEMEVSRNVSVREVFEAKNLARVTEYIRSKAPSGELDEEIILLLHRMLMVGIDDEIAVRFRMSGEYVRVGSHIAVAPEKIEGMMREMQLSYASNLSSHFLENIAAFHLEF